MTERFALDPHFRIVAAGGTLPSITPEIKREIDQLWLRHSRESRHEVFDGPVLSVINHSAHEIVVSCLSYRYLIAGRLAPDIRHALRIRPLGVTGVLRCPDGVVLGCRSQHVSYPDLWECAPSGGLQTAEDPKRQLVQELEEETGLTAGHLQHIEVASLLWDSEHEVFDIAYRLQTSARAERIYAAHAGIPEPREYSRLIVIAPSDIPTFLAGLQGRYVSTAASLLASEGYLT